eukprot:14637614-Heterocapsa_arctica.AAC.1
MVGFGAPAAAAAPGLGRWRLADTASVGFGTIVPDEALGDNDNVVTRGNKGCAKTDNVWVFIESVADSDL